MHFPATIQPDGTVQLIVGPDHPRYVEIVAAVAKAKQQACAEKDGVGLSVWSEGKHPRQNGKFVSKADKPIKASKRQEAEPQVSSEDYKALAEFYAETWNAAGVTPDTLEDDEIETVGDELEPGEWILAWDDDDEKWIVGKEDSPDDEPVQMSVHRAPKGGVSIAGKQYRGGMFIPGGVYASATPEEKAKIDNDAKARTDKRRGRGSVDHGKLQELLKPHAEQQLDAGAMASTKRAFNALMRHHGDLVVHRLEEIAQGLATAYAATPEDEEGKRQQFAQRLRGVAHMLDMAKQAGHTGEVKHPEKAAEPESYSVKKIKKGEDYTLDTGETKKRLGSDVFAVVDSKGRVRTSGSSQDTYEAKHAAESAVRRAAKEAEPDAAWHMTLNQFAEKHTAGRMSDKSDEARDLAGQGKHADATATAQGWGNVNKPDARTEHRAAVETALAAGKPVPPEVLADYPDLQPDKSAAPSAATFTAPSDFGSRFAAANDLGKHDLIAEALQGKHGPDVKMKVETALDDRAAHGGKLAAKHARVAREFAQEGKPEVAKGEAPAQGGKVDASPSQKQDAEVKAKFGNKKGVELLRAPAGGKRSDVDGEWYHGGQLMPVHGLSPKQEKTAPNGDGVGTVTQANEDGKGRGRTQKSEMTPEQIEEEKQRRQEMEDWQKIGAGPLGKVKWMGESPNAKAMSSGGTQLKDWQSWAESVGPEGVVELVKKLEPLAHKGIDEAAPDQSGADWAKENIRKEANQTTAYGNINKGHEKKYPGSHYARQLVHELLDGQNNALGKTPIERMKAINELMASAQSPAPATPPATAAAQPTTPANAEQVRAEVAKAGKTEGSATPATQAFRVERDNEGNVRGVYTSPSGEVFKAKWRVDTGLNDDNLRDKTYKDYVNHLELGNKPGSSAEADKNGKEIARKRAEFLDHATGGKAKDVVAEYQGPSGGTRKYRVIPKYDGVSGVHFVAVYDDPESGIHEREMGPKHESYEDAAADIGTHLQGVESRVGDMQIHHPGTKKQFDAVKEMKSKKAQDELEAKNREEAARQETGRANQAAKERIELAAKGTKGKKGTLSVAGQQVPATHYGPFAVHRDGKKFVVSHAGTAMKAAEFDSMADAINAAHLMGSGGDWGFTDAKKADQKTLSAGARIIKALKDRDYAAAEQHAQGLPKADVEQKTTAPSAPAKAALPEPTYKNAGLVPRVVKKLAAGEGDISKAMFTKGDDDDINAFLELNGVKDILTIPMDKRRAMAVEAVKTGSVSASPTPQPAAAQQPAKSAPTDTHAAALKAIADNADHIDATKDTGVPVTEAARSMAEATGMPFTDATAAIQRLAKEGKLTISGNGNVKAAQGQAKQPTKDVDQSLWTTKNSLSSHPQKGPDEHQLTRKGVTKAFNVANKTNIDENDMRTLQYMGGGIVVPVERRDGAKMTRINTEHFGPESKLLNLGFIQSVPGDVRAFKITDKGKQALDSGYAEGDKLIARIKVAHPIDDAKHPATSQTAAEQPQSVEDAYKHLTRMTRYEDGLVDMPTLYHTMKDANPSLTPQAFHADLMRRWKAGEIELKQANETRLMDEPELAIKDGDANYYHVFAPSLMHGAKKK